MEEEVDTSARFVAGDPGARFGDSAPLEYEVTGENGHPHWELIFEYILRQCGYLVDFHTVYCACSFFRGTFSSQKKCLFLAPWKISGMINI